MSPQRVVDRASAEHERLTAEVERLEELCRAGEDRYSEHLAAYKALRAFERRAEQNG